MSKQWDIFVPPFFTLDNIIINKQVFMKSDTNTLERYYEHLQKDDVDSELMPTEEFNFYLDHIHSILNHVLNADFFEFHK